MIATSGSLPSQYVLLTFLKITDFIHLQNALQELSGIAKKQYNGALHFQHDKQCICVIDFFTSLVFLSKGDAFEGLAKAPAPGTQATILNTGLFDIDNEDV